VNWSAVWRIEDLRLAVQGDGFLDHAHLPFCFHAVGDAPVQDVAAVEIDHGLLHRTAESPAYGYIGDVHGSYLVATHDLQITQQIGELILGGIGHGGAGQAVHRLDAHGLH